MTRKPEHFNEINKSVGKEIRRLRKLKKIPLKHIAESIDVTVAMLSKYELGEANICLGRLYLIAKALDVNINFFTNLR